MVIVLENYRLSEKSCAKLAKLYTMGDMDTIHFLWDCCDNTVDTLGGCVALPQSGNPFHYLFNNGYIEDTYQALYQVFCAKLDEAVLNGVSDNSLDAVVKMRFSADGAYRLCHIYTNLLKDENSKATDIHVNIRPFTAKEELDHEVLSVFTSDKNPAIFSKKLADMMAACEVGHMAYIQFDVERFKLINDQYGSEFGDELLKFFSDSLKVICSEKQPFCRLTADVFMIGTEFGEKQELIDFVHKIESRLSDYKGIEYRLIFGICIVEDKSVSTRRHGDNASLARQSIKGNALKNIEFFESTMLGELRKQQVIEDDMHKAAINGEFVMYLQPKYCISTKRIIGGEALARWIHPEKGMISPADFIPIFEKNGYIIKLDCIIWEMACKQLRHWLDEGVKPVPISVNVSREYLSSCDVVDIISKLVAKYDVPKDLFELEITESIESNNVREIVTKFKENGFKMLMDDFGSGYSSLNMLRSTQFDVLKIDRGFFSEFMESDRGRKIISHTITMSQDIGLDIIAEGVETREQAEFLYHCGCNAAQGFLYSRPVPVEEFDRMIREQNSMDNN